MLDSKVQELLNDSIKASILSRKSALNVIDLIKQESDMLFIETRHLNNAVDVDALMQETPSQRVKEGSTFHWDFATHTWLENTATNQAYAQKVEQKQKRVPQNEKFQLKRTVWCDEEETEYALTKLVGVTFYTDKGKEVTL